MPRKKQDKNRILNATKTTMVTSYDVQLDREGVLGALRAKGLDVPDDASVFVQVPGGGDWSGESLEIGSDTDLFVRWSVTSQHRHEGQRNSVTLMQVHGLMNELDGKFQTKRPAKSILLDAKALLIGHIAELAKKAGVTEDELDEVLSEGGGGGEEPLWKFIGYRDEYGNLRDVQRVSKLTPLPEDRPYREITEDEYDSFNGLEG